MSLRTDVRWFAPKLLALHGAWFAFKAIVLFAIWCYGWWSEFAGFSQFLYLSVVVEFCLWCWAARAFSVWIAEEYWMKVKETALVVFVVLTNFYTALVLLASVFGVFGVNVEFLQVAYAVVVFANGNQSVLEVIDGNESVFLAISVLSYLMLAIVLSLVISAFRETSK